MGRLMGLCAAMTAPLWVLVLIAAVIGERVASVEVAFVSQRENDDEIYLLDVSRNLVVNLTRTAYWRGGRFESQDQSPAWSPDGQRLAFHSNRAGNHDIYVMDANGRNVQRLTFNPAMDMHPAWSPDGCCIVYQAWHGRDFEIYTLNVEAALAGEPPTPLTDNRHGERHPAYSPDGTRIIFASDEGNILGNFGLFTMNTDGTDRRQIAIISEHENALHPVYSPDGAYIIYDSFRENTSSSVFILRGNGRGRTHLLAGEARRNGIDAYLPNWTPDGEHILYVSSVTGVSEVYLAPIVDEFELGTPRQLTQNPTIDIHPVMRPPSR